ncbi:uncharacterized protein BXZ73DRAFT_92891 [Epithele typhae]|uniref:uncharacterized protein n=1 Tax=Epithele typhae TaxID=378194 RepID=UPI00200869D6|nr:uncharacterized protein BXZ73DRAFT_92891 [Epithele typhae]KAH9913986.1 hypothetical protein BXZ73DRAFT_92891 [Epithele typhae]
MPGEPVKLVTVNTAPDRAKRLIGRVVEDVRDSYTIVYAANAERIEDVKPMLLKERPDVVFTASMWTLEESQKIVQLAKETVPGIKTFCLPYGLQAEKGPDAVVEYIEENLPGLLG